MKNILSGVSIGGFILVSVLVLLASKFSQEWARSMMDTILPMIVQCWIINFTTIINFHYGSSAGSGKKTDSILKLIEKSDLTVPTDK